MAVDRKLLRQCERRAIGRQIVMRLQCTAIRDLNGSGERILETASGLDAIQQSGVSGRDALLHDRAAGAAIADGVADRAVLLDDQFLGHHYRLGSQRIVRVRAVIGQRRRGDHEAA